MKTQRENLFYPQFEITPPVLELLAIIFYLRYNKLSIKKLNTSGFGALILDA
jgi:hypothetical protein